jgi:hypothetical protein
MKAEIYTGVSTFDREPENQLWEIRRYVDARGWSGVEYVDRGVSGRKARDVSSPRPDIAAPATALQTSETGLHVKGGNMAEKGPEKNKGDSPDELVRDEAQPAEPVESLPPKATPERVKQDIEEEDRFEATDN